LRELARQNLNLAKISVWRCVMSSQERVKAELCAGRFSECLVEGDAEQNARERKIRRRAIMVSIVLQSTALTAFVIAPLFAKPAELVGRKVVPIPPYGHKPAQQHPAPAAPNRAHVQRFIFAPTSIPANIRTHDEPQAPGEEIDPGQAIGLTGTEGSLTPLHITDPRPEPPHAEEVTHEKKRIHESHVDPALLTRRIEPVFPPWARQIGRSGKVELHALIGTDGSVQELEVVSGDPLFISSALDAVRQWHYRPTYLNGQPVEIDTFISVIYTLQ
jgi:protein TonB